MAVCWDPIREVVPGSDRIQRIPVPVIVSLSEREADSSFEMSTWGVGIFRFGKLRRCCLRAHERKVVSSNKREPEWFSGVSIHDDNFERGIVSPTPLTRFFVVHWSGFLLIEI